MKTRNNELAATHKDGSKLYAASLWYGRWRDYSFCPTAKGSQYQPRRKAPSPKVHFGYVTSAVNLKGAGWTWAKRLSKLRNDC